MPLKQYPLYCNLRHNIEKILPQLFEQDGTQFIPIISCFFAAFAFTLKELVVGPLQKFQVSVLACFSHYILKF